MALQSTSGEFASANFDEDDDTPMLNLAIDNIRGGEYTSVVNNIFNHQTSNIRHSVDGVVQSLQQISKRRLRELMLKQNNELFTFLQHPYKTPSHFGIAEMLCRKYGCGVIPRVYKSDNDISRELNVDSSMNTIVNDVSTDILKHGKSSLSELSEQLKFICNQYLFFGEEMVRLEGILIKKLNVLDNLNKKVPLLTSLHDNVFLQELIDTFEKYVKQEFADLTIENTYKELVAAYKKWYLFKEIIALQMRFTCSDSNTPICSICLSEPVSHAIVPCGHTMCGTCAKQVTTTCYICRGAVRERVRLFFC